MKEKGDRNGSWGGEDMVDWLVVGWLNDVQKSGNVVKIIPIGMNLVINLNDSF